MDFDLNPWMGDGSLTHVCQRLLCLRHDPSSDHLHCLGDEADLAGNVKCVVDLKSEISKVSIFCSSIIIPLQMLNIGQSTFTECQLYLNCLVVGANGVRGFLGGDDDASQSVGHLVC